MLMPTTDEIRSHFNAAEFVLDTRKQINKDLMGLSTTEVATEGSFCNQPLKGLLEGLQPIIEVLNRTDQLSQFIYKVDLPEEIYHQALIQKDFEELSYLIVQREAQKVFLRRKFRPQ